MNAPYQLDVVYIVANDKYLIMPEIHRTIVVRTPTLL